jgi:hypothetical protein
MENNGLFLGYYGLNNFFLSNISLSIQQKRKILLKFGVLTIGKLRKETIRKLYILLKKIYAFFLKAPSLVIRIRLIGKLTLALLISLINISE